MNMHQHAMQRGRSFQGMGAKEILGNSFKMQGDEKKKDNKKEKGAFFPEIAGPTY